MTILEQMNRFAEHYGRSISVNQTTWRYYRLGAGAPMLWLTGGLRRAALGFAFLERLATRHLVIAPDYVPVKTVDEFLTALDAIVRREGIQALALGGQSYGGLLAQAYLAHRPEAVDQLILSSSGPANYGKGWLPVEYAAIALARLLPEKAVKNMLLGGLVKFLSLPESERAEWLEAIDAIMQRELTRADVISHFAVAADLIRRGLVTPAAYRDWPGRVIVLSAQNDPTQSSKDLPRYEQLFGRAVEVVDMGNRGHADRAEYSRQEHARCYAHPEQKGHEVDEGNAQGRFPLLQHLLPQETRAFPALPAQEHADH
jgi:pimeloyl-ACP methyl ester carboxylesterase